MQSNALRGLLYEFGIVLPEGHQALLKRIPDGLAKARELGRLSETLVISVQEQLKHITCLQQDIDQLDRRLVHLVKQNPQMQAIQTIPSIGLLMTTALLTKGEAFDQARWEAAGAIVA